MRLMTMIATVTVTMTMSVIVIVIMHVLAIDPFVEVLVQCLRKTVESLDPRPEQN